MKTLLLASLLLFHSAAHADMYFDTDEGKVTLLVSGGCDIPGDEPNNLLYGMLLRNDGHIDEVCWRFEDVYHIYIGGRHLTFLINEIKYERQPNDPAWIFDEPAPRPDPLSS